MYTDVNGNDVGEQGTFPFGESWYSNNTTSSWVFTTYERDKESGKDYALARSYANNQGRFLAPDPLEGIMGDPQSWNRYAYSRNDPINLSDPSGQSWLGDLLSGLFAELGPAFGRIMTSGQIINISDWKWIGQIPLEGTEWYAREVGDHVLQLLEPNEVAIIQIAKALDASFTLPNLAEVGVKGIEGAQLFNGLRALPSLGKALLSFLRGPGIQTLGLAGVEAGEGIAEGALQNAPAAGKTAYQLGEEGEAAVRDAYNIGDKVTIQIDGRVRIPDGLIPGESLSEVKNVGRLSYTKQLRDYESYAQSNGMKFDLYVRPNTTLSGPLEKAIKRGTITFRFIP